MKSQELLLMIFQRTSLFSKQWPTISKDDENMSLKNKCLFGGWILMASKLSRKENLHSSWIYTESTPNLHYKSNFYVLHYIFCLILNPA